MYPARRNGKDSVLFSCGECILDRCSGEVPEWTIGTVSKTVVPSGVPWVRIPPSPIVLGGCQAKNGASKVTRPVHLSG